MNPAILFLWTVLSENRDTNENETIFTVHVHGWRRKHSAGKFSEIHKQYWIQWLHYPAWHNLGKHAHRKVTGMLKANEHQPGAGANMPQLHGSCYQAKAEQAAGHTTSPFPVNQEWQDRSTETLVGCLCVFFLRLTSFFYHLYSSRNVTWHFYETEYDLERQEISRLHELTV